MFKNSPNKVMVTAFKWMIYRSKPEKFRRMSSREDTSNFPALYHSKHKFEYFSLSLKFLVSYIPE